MRGFSLVAVVSCAAITSSVPHEKCVCVCASVSLSHPYKMVSVAETSYLERV